MTRLYEIKSCYDCPHHWNQEDKSTEYCTYNEEKNRILNANHTWNGIDRDCPLPIKKEEIIQIKSCSDCTNPQMMHTTKEIILDVDDNMSKNSLIQRIQEKYTSLNKEYHQLKKEIETDKPFQIEAWIDNESNYLNIKITNYDKEYTKVHQAFKNIEKTYDEFDKIEWGSMYIIGRYEL